MYSSMKWPARGLWTIGQAQISRNDLKSVIRNQKQPFLYPELEWEQKGFVDGTTVSNTLVPFKGQWLLYYGAADRYTGLAVFTPQADSPFSLVLADATATPGEGAAAEPATDAHRRQ
jgi:hypothetical protein